MLNKTILRNKKDFSRIYSKGKSIGDRYIVLFFKRNNLDYYRKAFLASKKVGNSVKRNRARRLMKESVRLLEFDLPKGYDYIFIARNTIDGKSYSEVSRSIKSALKRSGTLNEKE
ncbi:MAG: ribonuclease P protein component [Christensenellales bacterium]